MDHFSVSTVKDGGVLKLESELDFEVKRLYQVIVQAMDRASLDEVNTAQATILIEVQSEKNGRNILFCFICRCQILLTNLLSGCR